MTGDLLVQNAMMVLPNRIVEGDLRVSKGLIKSIAPHGGLVPESHELVIDGTGLHLLPGVIDPHVPKENYGILVIFEPQNLPPQACLGATKTRVSESFERGDAFCTSICYHNSKARSCGLQRRFEEMRKLFTSMEKIGGKFLTLFKSSLEPTEASF